MPGGHALRRLYGRAHLGARRRRHAGARALPRCAAGAAARLPPERGGWQRRVWGCGGYYTSRAGSGTRPTGGHVRQAPLCLARFHTGACVRLLCAHPVPVPPRGAAGSVVRHRGAAAQRPDDRVRHPPAALHCLHGVHARAATRRWRQAGAYDVLRPSPPPEAQSRACVLSCLVPAAACRTIAPVGVLLSGHRRQVYGGRTGKLVPYLQSLGVPLLLTHVRVH